MKHIEINIGKACNSKCIFCMSSKENKIFNNKNDIFLLIKKYSELGYKSIGFLGGEITIHPYVLEIIEYAKIHNFLQINIVTNGIRLSDNDFLKKIIDNGVTRINISIHSYDSATEDFLTGIPGGFIKKITAINNIIVLMNSEYYKGSISINVVLNRLNFEKISEFCLYFYNKGIKDIRINYMWPRNLKNNNFKKLVVTYSELNDYIKKIAFISVKKGLRITIDSIPLCIFYNVFGKNYKKITAFLMGENNDSLINEVEEFDSKNKSNKIIWKDLKTNSLKKKDEKCLNCIYFKECEGIWSEYVKHYGFEEFKPIIDEK